MNKHGFTLMEILAVLLVLAVVTSFAVPAIRRVRHEVYHSQAKNAASKMADAVRSYYQNTKGYLPSTTAVCGRKSSKDTSVTCTEIINISPNLACNVNYGRNGIPANGTVNGHTLQEVPVAELFRCGYLVTKDFVSLPYVFVVDTDPFESGLLVTATGLTDAGNNYKGKKLCVYRDGSIKEGC